MCYSACHPRALCRAPKVHFVDLYRPSAALHWDGHIKGDPIHFYAYMRYYEQAAEIMMAALHHHCPHA